MAFSNEQLSKLRMKNLAGASIGNVMGTTTGLAISATPANIQVADAAVAMQLPNGQINTTTQDTDIDLSDTAICAEGGQVIQAEVTEFCIFVLQDGTNVLARLGEHTKRMKRTTLNGALTEEVVMNTVPSDVDNETYVVTGFVHCAKASGTFTVGTTSFASGTITDTYYETGNLLAGSRAI
jgi:hypothetical protein